MLRRAALIACCSCWLLAACSTPELVSRTRLVALMDELGQQDAARHFPQEYRNLAEAFGHGEAALHAQGDEQEAESYYLLALQKGDVLRSELLDMRRRAAEEAQRRAAEQAARAEEERLRQEAARAEARLQEQNRLQAAAEAAAKAKLAQKDASAHLPSSYTVRRGETLPQIAGRTEIYNDASLWPIIYRANRDQIRDPKRLWPGQVLAIPRHFSRDEAVEARRYSGRR